MSDRDAVSTGDLSSTQPEQASDTKLVDEAYLTNLVPKQTNFDLGKVSELVRQNGLESSGIEQRESLFFDESIEILLCLQLPLANDAQLRSQLSRLVIFFSVQVAGGKSSGQDGLQSLETIHVERITNATAPVVVQEDDSGQANDAATVGASRRAYAFWKQKVFLPRPRTRMHSPSIIISASASLYPVSKSGFNEHGNDYLPSGKAAGANILESFASDLSVNGISPRLSALRVSCVAPITRKPDLATHLRALPKLTLSIFPVIHARIRFSKSQTAGPSSSIAILELDFASRLECEVVIEEVELKCPECEINCLDPDAALQLPMRRVAHDNVTFLYQLLPHRRYDSTRPETGILAISIAAAVQVIPDICVPRLSLTWTTTVDLDTPTAASTAAFIESGVHQSHNHAQSLNAAITPLKKPSLSQPDELPGLRAPPKHAQVDATNLGIVMTISGPNEPVRPGDVFAWTMNIVNRASDGSPRAPRKLAIVAIPKRRRNEARPVRPPSTATRRPGEDELADAVLDETMLHAMQKSSRVDETEVICLNADTRIGPLVPGSCQTIELQFLALREGKSGIEAIRVIDMVSQEHVDITDLPVTIVRPATP